MTEKRNTDDGGQAFPEMQRRDQFSDDAGAWISVSEPTGGMSLRDYFAAKALSAFTRELKDEQYHSWSGNSGIIAEKCYAMADAMIRQRKVQS